MRKGIDGLALLVQEALKRDPHSGHLFVFRGRSGGLIKVLRHDGQGMCVLPNGWSVTASSGIAGRWCRDDHAGIAWLPAQRHRLAHAATDLATAGRWLIEQL
jgi:hypothetical protein